jgi:hypothetical protein
VKRRKFSRLPVVPQLMVEPKPDHLNLTPEAWAIVGEGLGDGSGLIKVIRLAGNHPDKWVPKTLIRVLQDQGFTELTSEHLQRLFYMALRQIYDQHRPGFGAMMDAAFLGPDRDWDRFRRLIAAGDMLTFLVTEYPNLGEMQ